MGHPNYAATFRGIVVNNSDPEGRNRCQLQIPQLLGGARSGWAVPIPAVGSEVPDVGSQVMVTFEGADLSRPAYFAATSSESSTDALAKAKQAESDAQKGIINAATAQVTANQALTNAATAQAAAKQAETDAQTGITNAAKAQSVANQAETDAQTGITNAAKAQTTANQAEADAQTALTNASKAQSSANTGQVSTDRIIAGSSALNANAAGVIASALPTKSISGRQLTDDALDGKTTAGMTLTAATVNGQSLFDSGWITFADAGINFTGGFAAYGSTCRFRAINGVVYMTGTVQVTSAMTSGSANVGYVIASWATDSVAAPYFTNFNGTAGWYIANSTSGGAGSLAVNGPNRSLLLSYRSVAQLPTGYFNFTATLPYL